MVDAIILLALAAAGMWLAASAFAQPKGVYARSAAGVMITVLAAAALWAAFPPRSAEAGLGAFFIFGGVSVIAIIAATLACSGASARYIWDALLRRRT